MKASTLAATIESLTVGITRDGTDAATPCQGQLWQSGDHEVEVISRGMQFALNSVSFSIK